MSTPDRSAALQAESVRVQLGGAIILDGVDVLAEHGTLHVIAGPNGAGKSTLLRTLLGLLQPSSGTVRCDGVEIQRLTRTERARRIAYVPQRSQLQSALRVDEVVGHGRYATLGLARDRASRVTESLERVGMLELAHRNYLTLSGGERRLTLIARALCTGARIICLDEPTACLDIGNRLRMLELLRELASQGYAIVCVLHELEDVRRFADDVLLLRRGTVRASGPPAEVIVPDHVREVYGVELRQNDAVGFHLPGGDLG